MADIFSDLTNEDKSVDNGKTTDKCSANSSKGGASKKSSASSKNEANPHRKKDSSKSSDTSTQESIVNLANTMQTGFQNLQTILLSAMGNPVHEYNETVEDDPAEETFENLEEGARCV